MSTEGTVAPETTLAHARLALREGAQKGMKCPCCDRFYKIYKRPLNSGMAHCLLRIHRYFELHRDAEWLHVSDFLRANKIQRADEAKLCHWDLLERKIGNRKDGSKRNGYYRITEKGVLFCAGELGVPKYVFLERNRVIGCSDGKFLGKPQMTDIREALGERFDYRQIMSWEV